MGITQEHTPQPPPGPASTQGKQQLLKTSMAPTAPKPAAASWSRAVQGGSASCDMGPEIKLGVGFLVCVFLIVSCPLVLFYFFKARPWETQVLTKNLVLFF